jgi:hypothetical protein
MIRPVSYATILDDPNWPALLAEYAAECSIPELGAPSPQRDLYELLEKSGVFQAFGVYDGETLVGFACVLIYVLPHYGAKIAATESIFVQKNYPLGTALMSHIERYAKEKDSSAFLYSAPVGSRFDRMLSAYSKARHTNNTYLVKL